MKALILLLTTSFSMLSFGQGECQMSYVSDHFVLNNIDADVTIWVDNKDQENFPTKGPEKYVIKPGERIKIADLEWAEEFRNPTQWYVFKVEPEGLTHLCDAKNWKFEKLTKTTGEYSLILEYSRTGGCVLEKGCMGSDSALRMSEPEEPPVILEEIYDFPDQEAQFPGGAEAMYKWLTENIRYPKEAIDNNILGKVFVQFVVETTGELTNIEIMRSPHDILSRETKRLIKAMPKWEPAKMKEKPVRSRYTLPVFFRLS